MRFFLSGTRNPGNSFFHWKAWWDGQVTRKRRICSRLYCIYIYMLKRAWSIDFMLMQNRFSASKSPQYVSWYWVRFVFLLFSLSLSLCRSFNTSLHKEIYHVKVVCSVQNPINIWSNGSGVYWVCVGPHTRKKKYAKAIVSDLYVTVLMHFSP